MEGARQRLIMAMLPAALVAAPAVLMPATGWAQQLEEITVTARRSEENVQDIPVAVIAIGSEFIDKQGISTTADILKLAPGVQFDQSFSSNDTRISIRGVNSTRGRASVAILVDGVDVSGESITVGGGSSLLNSRLLDLERVEIVKGPQSALYGRSAFAGAINYITKKPSLEASEINVIGDYGTDTTYSGKATASVAIVPGVFSMGLTAASYQSDGFYTNPVNGQSLNGYDDKGLRLAAVWTPTESLSFDASVSYEENAADPRAVVKVAPANTFWDASGNLIPNVTNPADPAQVPPGGYGNWLGTIGSVNESDISLSNSESLGTPFPGSEDERVLAILNIGWDIGGVTLRSITSYLNNDGSIAEDVDYQTGTGSPNATIGGFNASVSNEFLTKTETTQINQELVLESNSWDRGRWLVGVQYYNEDVDNADNSLNWFNDPAFIGFDPNCGVFYACSAAQSQTFGTPVKLTSRETESYSVFGLISYDVTDKLGATFEARFIKDTIEAGTNTLFSRVDQSFFGLNTVQPTSDKTTTNEFNPRFALDYRFTDDVMAYGSVARGTKPGGYGTAQWARPELSELKPEELTAYELGTKTTWFGSTLRANGALFYNEYKNRQIGITVFDPLNPAMFPAAGVSNAGAAETKGLEVELQWLATETLTFGLGYAYTDTEWTDYDFRKIRENGPTAKDKAICGNANGDCAGAEIAGIPKHALSFLADYTQPLGGTGLDLFMNGIVTYTGERTLSDQVVTPEVDANTIVDAQIGLQTEAWSAMIFATNLLDNDQVTWAQATQTDFLDGNLGNFGAPRDDSAFAFLPVPRIVGVRASYKFGGN
jgi:iron complex outermembrane receptor protein